MGAVINTLPDSELDCNGDSKQTEPNVHITQQDVENDGHLPISGQTYNFAQRIGKTISLLAAASLALTCIFIGFIYWLWFGDRSSAIWRRLTLAGGSNQAVTISTLVLRFALSTLGGIATAMVAAVALERSGSPLRDAASLSVARFTRPSPYSFLFETLTHRNFITLALRALLLLLIISTFAVQLSSTILLNDLEIRPVEGFLQRTTNMAGYSWEGGQYGALTGGVDSSGTYDGDAGFDASHSPFENQQKYWTGLSKTFNLFAETSDKPSVEPAADQIIGDTGPTLRAFLPINDQTVRRNLMRYSGVATVFDARIVCLRPDIVTGSVSDGSIDMTLKLPSVSDIMPGITTTDQEFEVSVPRVRRVATKAWSIVPLSNSVGGMVSSLDPASRQNASLVFEPYGRDNRKPNRFAGEVSIDGVWQTSDELACGVDLGNTYLIMDSGQDPALIPDVSSPEDVANVPPDQIGYAMGSMTICFDALPKNFLYHQIQDFEITASGPGNMSEPQTTFRSETVPDDIPVLRTQLAATDEARAMDMISRGLLNLTSADSIRDTVAEASKDWEAYCTKSSELDRVNRDATTPRQYPPNIYNRTTYPRLSQLALYESNPIDLCGGLCRRRVPDWSEVRGGTTLVELLIHIIQEYQHMALMSPEVALQTLITQLLRDVYYTWIIRFDSESEVDMVPSVPVQVPAGSLGFWVVMGIIFLHLGICMMAFIAFAIFTSSSRLGNGWQAVADIVKHEDGERIIAQLRQLDDAHLDEQLKAEAAQGRTFVIRQRQ